MSNVTLPREVYHIRNESAIGSESQFLEFEEIRNHAIVEEASKYSLSIVRFEVDAYSLPTFIADIEKFPNTDPCKMIQTVILDYSTFSTQPKNLEWKPTNLHITKPPNLSLNSPSAIDSEYYYGNSFRHFCDLVNTAFDELTVELLKTLVGPALNNMIAPKMIWNEDNQTCSIIAQEEFFNWSRTNHVGIYFNRSLYGRFTSLPATKNYNDLSKVYKIYMKDDYSTKVILLDPSLNNTTTQFIKTDQEYSTISNWSPVSNLVFTSQRLPIVASEISEPLNYYNGVLSKGSGAQQTQRIITDMATNDMCYKPNLLYVPSAEYRYIDMVGNSSVKTIDLRVY